MYLSSYYNQFWGLILFLYSEKYYGLRFKTAKYINKHVVHKKY